MRVSVVTHLKECHLAKTSTRDPPNLDVTTTKVRPKLTRKTDRRDNNAINKEIRSHLLERRGEARD